MGKPGEDESCEIPTHTGGAPKKISWMVSLLPADPKKLNRQRGNWWAKLAVRLVIRCPAGPALPVLAHVGRDSDLAEFIRVRYNAGGVSVCVCVCARV
jgi:hypothetical protein